MTSGKTTEAKRHEPGKGPSDAKLEDGRQPWHASPSRSTETNCAPRCASSGTSACSTCWTTPSTCCPQVRARKVGIAAPEGGILRPDTRTRPPGRARPRS